MDPKEYSRHLREGLRPKSDSISLPNGTASSLIGYEGDLSVYTNTASLRMSLLT